jgi:hypothetical protein
MKEGKQKWVNRPKEVLFPTPTRLIKLHQLNAGKSVEVDL